MNSSKTFFFFFTFMLVSFAQAGIEGGNISDVNLTTVSNATWHGVCGQASPAAAVPVMINATAGNMTVLTINTGSGSYPYGVLAIYLLFSNSSTPITSLSSGDLSVLDAFSPNPAENGTATFIFSTSFTVGAYGTIAGVPTTYTKAYLPSTFPLGYMNDQDGNLVFITPVVDNQRGYNGSLFDFQFMLPTNNGTATLYYLTIVVIPAPAPPVPPTAPAHAPPAGGGGTRTPYYNVTVPPAYECYSDADCGPDEYCDIFPGETGGTCRPKPVPGCEIILYCGDWGPCDAESYRYQPCTDIMNCSNITVYRVERCAPLPPIIPPLVPEEIITVIVQPEFPCLSLLLLLLLIGLIAYIVRKRSQKKGEKSR